MAARQRFENDTLERAVILGKNEVADAFTDLVFDRRKVSAYAFAVGALCHELGFELRVMRAETELDAALRRKVFDPFQHHVDMRLAEPV